MTGELTPTLVAGTDSDREATHERDTAARPQSRRPRVRRTGRSGAAGSGRLVAIVPPLLAVAVMVGVWELAVAVSGVKPYVLPSATRVLSVMVKNRADLWENTLPTLQETLIGIGVTVIVSFVIAVLCDFSVWARRTIYPPLIGSQSIPIIVLAPLMVIWFGFGLLPKVIVIALVTFFPITVALIDGFNSTSPEATNLLRSMGASRLQQFLKVRLPTALPGFFTGLRISIAFSVVAAIFGEYVGAVRGLGVYMSVQGNSNRTDLVLAAVIISAAISIVLFCLTFVLERLVCPWSKPSGGRQ
ncbi:MAG: NitT/TauT family transport system permease protein [Solirubrobacteraceae bacterium]